ncbi:prostatic acid phosphatase-like [Diorhabda sublineata]|uniref:prostatic acid phosphatase-like n=1 Tax=Diorhabda sublineata TaxID=1163346 RepID=UPI0024E08083|nr:prostatic acid phosphatase-like [Diorhabda sublineata]
MRCQFLLILGIVYFAAEVYTSELIAVVLIFRHGDRTPVDPYPNDPYGNKSYWPVGFGQLTNKGKEQHFKFGKWLRKRYNNFLPEIYSEEDIYIMSTDVDRTLMSAEANLAGLYPPVGKEIWDKNMKWVPIPIHTRPVQLDPILAAKKPCPKYDKMYEELYETDYFKHISHENHDLYKYLTKNTGYTVSNLQKIQYLYSNLLIETLYNYTLPSWTSKVFPDKLFALASLGFAVETFTTEMARLKTGPLFDLIINYFTNRTNNIDGTPKVLILSAHDTTIANVLNSMGVFEYHCPPYTSTIFFELKKSSTKNTFLNLYYKNSSTPRQIKLKDCDVDCNFSDFVKILRPITISLNQWEIECKLNLFMWPLSFQWSIILSCSLIIIILIMSAVVAGIRSKKQCTTNYSQLPNEEYT